MAFSRAAKLRVAKGPSTEAQPASTEPLGTGYRTTASTSARSRMPT